MSFFTVKKEEVFDLNKNKKQIVGRIGEDAGVIYLESLGFNITDRNYLKKWGELDIVAERDNIIHFIEVKSLSFCQNINKSINSIISHETWIKYNKNVSYETKICVSYENNKENKLNNDYYRAEDNIHPQKIERLKRVIQTYMIDKDIYEKKDWQFDVVTVKVDHDKKLCRVGVLWNIVL